MSLAGQRPRRLPARRLCAEPRRSGVLDFERPVAEVPSDLSPGIIEHWLTMFSASGHKTRRITVPGSSCKDPVGTRISLFVIPPGMKSFPSPAPAARIELSPEASAKRSRSGCGSVPAANREPCAGRAQETEGPTGEAQRPSSDGKPLRVFPRFPGWRERALRSQLACRA
jgi:hypothetical protein